MGIVGGLLLGWIFGLFGFKGVVIAGMWQLFGIKVTVLGYYFIFALLGLFSWIVNLFRRPRQDSATLTINGDGLDKLKKVLLKK